MKKILTGIFSIIMILSLTASIGIFSAAAAETETTGDAEEQDAGPFTDPEAFESFSKIVYPREITLGETTFGEIGINNDGEYDYIDQVIQFKDDTHDSVVDAESLEPGAFGIVITDIWMKTGASLIFRIYNPSDAPAAIEDCVIIGMENEEGVLFSNDIQLSPYKREGYDALMEKLIEILGEPNEFSGKMQDPDYINGAYIWRDEDDTHYFGISVLVEGDNCELNGMAIYDYSIADQAEDEEDKDEG